MNTSTLTMTDFTIAAAQHRRALHIHCYRLLANFEEAEDAVQDTLARAWQAQARFDGANLRAWLYRIATNVCLDRMRQVKTLERSYAEIAWLQPYPDGLLEAEPGERMVARETIELAFLAVIQLLPPRQRAVLILRDVLEWSAADTAAALDMSLPAVTSALQRARATLAATPREHAPENPPSPHERELLRRYVEAHERMDPEAAISLVRADIDITMPPHPMHFWSHDGMRYLWNRAAGMGEWRLTAAWVNRMPCAASYLRTPGESTFGAFKLDVLSIQGDLIVATTTFNAELFGAFGLPGTLAA